jgi:hypothetical protein
VLDTNQPIFVKKIAARNDFSARRWWDSCHFTLIRANFRRFPTSGPRAAYLNIACPGVKAFSDSVLHGAGPIAIKQSVSQIGGAFTRPSL